MQSLRLHCSSFNCSFLSSRARRSSHTLPEPSTNAPLNDNSSGTALSLQAHQISSAHISGYLPPTASDRIAQEPASTGSSRARPRTFGSRLLSIWRSLGGWRRFAKCDHHRTRVLGCRHQRIYRRRRQGGVRRPAVEELGRWFRRVSETRGPYFEAQDLGLNEGERFAVDFDKAFARLIFRY